MAGDPIPENPAEAAATVEVETVETSAIIRDGPNLWDDIEVIPEYVEPEPEVPEPTPEPEPVIEEPTPEPEPVIEEPTPEPELVVEEPEPVIEEPTPELEPEPIEDLFEEPEEWV